MEGGLKQLQMIWVRMMQGELRVRLAEWRRSVAAFALAEADKTQEESDEQRSRDNARHQAESDELSAKHEAESDEQNAKHQAECDELKAEVAREMALVGANGDAVVCGLQAQIEIKVQEMERLRAENKAEKDRVHAENEAALDEQMSQQSIKDKEAEKRHQKIVASISWALEVSMLAVEQAKCRTEYRLKDKQIQIENLSEDITDAGKEVALLKAQLSEQQSQLKEQSSKQMLERQELEGMQVCVVMI